MQVTDDRWTMDGRQASFDVITFAVWQRKNRSGDTVDIYLFIKCGINSLGDARDYTFYRRTNDRHPRHDSSSDVPQ